MEKEENRGNRTCDEERTCGCRKREDIARERRDGGGPQAMEGRDLKLGVLERRRGGGCTERRRHEVVEGGSKTEN